MQKGENLKNLSIKLENIQFKVKWCETYHFFPDLVFILWFVNLEARQIPLRQPARIFGFCI